MWRIVISHVHTGIEVDTRVSIELKQHRFRCGMSAAELARLSGVPLTTIRRIEREPGASISLDSAERLADALGVHAALLIERMW